MLIFIFTTSYPDAEFPSKNIFVYEQAKELANRGHRIVVLHVKKLPVKRLFKQIDRDIRVFDDVFAKRYFVQQKTLLDRKFHSLNKVIFVNSVNKLFARAIEEEGVPDVLYAHFSCWAGVAAARISKKFNVPLVALEHYGGLLGDKISKIQKAGIEEVINQSSVFLCVSEGLKRALQKKVSCSKEIKVVPNMIDRRFVCVPPVKKEIFVFSSIGNLYKEKGFELLINAFCKAFDADQPVELRIGGGGPMLNHLQKLIDTNKRLNQIHLIGRLTREQTIQEYCNCDYFVLASNHETFGMVYREALITGRPIITTDHGGFSGSDWHECYGYKIPVGDEETLVSKLRSAVARGTTYNYKEISETCMKDCSAEKVGDLVENYLKYAIKK